MHEDQESYYRFTGPARLETATNTLFGLVQGIVADGKVDNSEMKALIDWASRHQEFSDKHPFNELIPAIQRIVADGIVDEEERLDLLWLCKQFSGENSYYDQLTSDMQQLHGLLAGIIADGVVTTDELELLDTWLGCHEHLKSCWPFDEVEALVTSVMADGKIDDEEQRQLLHFFSEFTEFRPTAAVHENSSNPSVVGVCASCPDIIFEDRLFCFTGSSDRGTRVELASIVEERGGKFHKRIRNDTDYLVIGASGNPCWAFSCYGRKVEDAVKRRRNGQRILVVHEFDFWDEIA